MWKNILMLNGQILCFQQKWSGRIYKPWTTPRQPSWTMGLKSNHLKMSRTDSLLGDAIASENCIVWQTFLSIGNIYNFSEASPASLPSELDWQQQWWSRKQSPSAITCRHQKQLVNSDYQATMRQESKHSYQLLSAVSSDAKFHFVGSFRMFSKHQVKGWGENWKWPQRYGHWARRGVEMQNLEG